MEPVAYIRRSARSRSDPGDLSREFQTDKVRQLANGDGPTLRIIDTDWGLSASTDKTDKRVAFLALLEAVERGEVSALYAYSTDRLARSVEWAARLLNACRRAGTVIVTSEGRFEPDDAMTDQLFYFQAMQNEGYSRQAVQKRRDAVARLRARGDKMGPTFYGAKAGEDLPAVVAAFRETGSAHGAAVLLNERGVQLRRPITKRRDGTMKPGAWTHSTVRHILAREGLVPKLATRGNRAKPVAPFALYRLLVCHCGHTLTAVRQMYGKDNRHSRVIYRCVSQSANANHGPKTIGEARILPAIQAQADRLRIPDAFERQADAGRRVDLAAQREKLLDLYLGDRFDKETLDRRLEALDDQLGALNDADQVVTIPAVDWSWPAADVNRHLRLLWERVEVGADLMPARFVSRLPAEYWV